MKTFQIKDKLHLTCKILSSLRYLHQKGPVTKTENIKTNSTKILRPTDFLRPKDIKSDKFFSVLFPALFKDRNKTENIDRFKTDGIVYVHY